MDDPKVKTSVVVVGQDVTLNFLSIDNLAGLAEARFSAFELSDDSVDSTAGLTPKASWIESLRFRQVPGGADKKKQYAASWIVGTESTKADIPEKTYLVSVVARKNSASKWTPGTNHIRIPGIAVTEKSELREIMAHEFSTQTSIGAGPRNWTFDPAPLRAFIKTLTPQQRMLLCSYNKPQLVAFISLRGLRSDRPMYADDGGKSKGDERRQSVLANADFSMFYCEKIGNRVILECHTEYFCVNNWNPGTQRFLSSIYGSLSPKAKSPKYWLTAADPRVLKGEVIYMRLVNGAGISVMGGNYIHGFVNTEGCWMLFRNYNWPIRVADKFLSIYCRDYRPQSGSAAKVTPKLRALGYDATVDNNIRSNSYHKWLDWDQNFAYSFFFERLIGVKFFTKAVPGEYEPNLYNTHGHTQSTTSFTLDEKSFEKAHHAPTNADGYDFHQVENVGSNGQWSHNPHYVWGENARGHKAAKAWERVFAECHLFNPDNRSLAELIKTPYVEPPAAVGPSP